MVTPIIHLVKPLSGKWPLWLQVLLPSLLAQSGEAPMIRSWSAWKLSLPHWIPLVIRFSCSWACLGQGSACRLQLHKVMREWLEYQKAIVLSSTPETVPVSTSSPRSPRLHTLVLGWLEQLPKLGPQKSIHRMWQSINTWWACFSWSFSIFSLWMKHQYLLCFGVNECLQQFPSCVMCCFVNY